MSLGDRLAFRLIERRVPVLVAAFLLTVFFGWCASGLEFSTSPETILRSDYEDLAHLRDHEGEFEDFERLVLFVFEVEDAFAPQVRTRVLSATKALSRLPFILGTRSVFDSGFPLPDPETDAAAFRRAALDNPLVSPFLVSANGRFGAVQAFVSREADAPARREESLRLMEDAVRGAGLTALTGGVPALRRTYAKNIREDVFLLPPLVSSVLLVLLYLAFGRLTLVLAPLLVVAVATVWTVGILALTGGTVTALTSILPSLTLVVGVATGVHVVSRFREERERGAEPKDAARVAVVRMVLPCGLTALTTAVGFCSLTVARISDVQQFGIYSALGALLAFLLGVPLVGVLLSFVRSRVRAKGPRTSPLDRPLRLLGHGISRRPAVAVGVGIVLAAVSIVGVTLLESETFALEDVSASDPLRKVGAIQDRHLGGMLSFELHIESAERLLAPETVRWAAALEARLREFPSVRAVAGPGTLLRQAAGAVGLPLLAEAGAPKLLGLISARGGRAAVAAFIAESRTLARITVRLGDVGSKTSAAVRREAIELARSGLPPGVEVRVAGLAVFAEELLGRLVTEMAKSTALAFVGIFLLMTLLLRSPALGALSMVPNFLPLLAAGGFMGVAGITVRSSIALIFAVALGIAVDDTVHMLTRYRRERRAGRAVRSAVRSCVRWTGRPVTLTSVVLFTGFLTFLSSDFRATEQFGLISAVTIAAALVGDLVLLPGLLLMRRRRR